ncbi:MAG: hypothetical protein CM15mP117_21130 [Alphaproteobacteria bacterium]|nr:MAG: hypothetical protein CM15mP117_21130 [Alphaproteobacteria bacterium]
MLADDASDEARNEMESLSSQYEAICTANSQVCRLVILTISTQPASKMLTLIFLKATIKIRKNISLILGC